MRLKPRSVPKRNDRQASPEPLPPGHWLWTQPFVTITPHVSAMTMRREAVAQVAQGVQALALGEAPPGLVQRGRGY